MDLGAGDDQFFGEDGGAFNLVQGGLGDDKIFGGNNFGASYPDAFGSGDTIEGS